MRFKQISFWAGLLLILVLLSVTSCGGSGGGSSSRSSFVVTANFAPYTGRDVPGYVGSLKITAQTGTDTPLGPFSFKRGDAPLEITGLRSGKTYRLSIEGFHGTNGTGAKVASATIERVASSAAVAVVIDTVNTEIASIRVSPNTTTLRAGESQVFTFEAKNSAGASILTSADESSFAALISPNVGSFNPATMTYTAPGSISQGQVPVRLDVSLGGFSGSSIIHFEDAVSRGVIDLRWNADTRGLPGYAKSARVDIVDGGLIVASKIAVRSSSGSHVTTVSFDGIDKGHYIASVTAYASTDASGEPVAEGAFPVSFEDGSAQIVDMGNDDFGPDRIRLYAQRGADAPFDATAGLVMNKGETLTVYGSAEDAMGTHFLSPTAPKLVLSGANTTLSGNSITGVVAGVGSSVRVNIGDVLHGGAPGTLTVPIEVKDVSPRVKFEIHWNDLDPEANSLRIVVDYALGTRQAIRVQRGKNVSESNVYLNQLTTIGGSRFLFVQTYLSNDGSGPVHREIPIFDYQGPLPPAIRLPRL